jgi:thiol:disulfide interchange protein
MHTSKRRLQAAVFALAAVALISIFCRRTGVRPSIDWRADLAGAFGPAKAADKPILVEFMAEWCPSCKAMEDSTFHDPAVVEKTGAFVAVRIDVDKQKETTARYNANPRKYGGIGIPNFLFLEKDGKPIAHVVGSRGPEDFIAVLDSVLALRKPVR